MTSFDYYCGCLRTHLCPEEFRSKCSQTYEEEYPTKVCPRDYSIRDYSIKCLRPNVTNGTPRHLSICPDVYSRVEEIIIWNLIDNKKKLMRNLYKVQQLQQMELFVNNAKTVLLEEETE